MILIAIIAFAIISSKASPTRNDGCSVSINGDLAEPQPLVLLAKGKGLDFVNPIDTTGTLNFEAGEEFRLACTGDGNYLVNVGNNDVQDIEAYCIGEKKFSVNSVEYEFSELTCSFLPTSVALVMDKPCLGVYTAVEIGFQVSESELVRTMEVCRNEETLGTYYVWFNLTKAIGGYQRGYPRPSWTQGDFYDPYSLDTQFTRAVQIATASTIVNSTELGAYYISTTTDLYLSRGHLTAKADFVYGSAHWSTFWYLNCHPQWQTFNGGNWNYLEQDVRSYASSKQLDLEIYTGVHGITTLTDEYGIQHPYYFYVSGEQHALPIPKFFWKILYDPLTQRGTAFIGINDPYLTKLTMDNYICNDISSEISWLTWYADNVQLGISYVCTVEDLRKVVPTLPPLNITGILT